MRGPEPTGLTVADVNGDGKLDLLSATPSATSWSSRATATARSGPTRKADQAVALAVADLTGDGKPDFIYANQGLDRVVVQYGGDQTTVLGDHPRACSPPAPSSWPTSTATASPT